MEKAHQLFFLAQRDLWASLLCALQLPSSDRAALQAMVETENSVYANLVSASVGVLIHQDRAGHAAVTASLAELDALVKAAFPTKPTQTVTDIVTLYEHAHAIEATFNQVSYQAFLLFLYDTLLVSRTNIRCNCSRL